MTEAAAVGAPAESTRIEEHTPGAIRVGREEGGTPVVAVGSLIVETGIAPEPCGRQEDLVAVELAGHAHTVHAALRRPRPCAFIAQPLPARIIVPCYGSSTFNVGRSYSFFFIIVSV